MPKIAPAGTYGVELEIVHDVYSSLSCVYTGISFERVVFQEKCLSFFHTLTAIA